MSLVAYVRRTSAVALAALALTAALLVGEASPAVSAPERTLSFVTWNVCKLDCSSPAPSWSVRRDRVARVINEPGADVVSVNEATDWGFGSRTQWEDIQSLAAPGGYATPLIEDDRCIQRGCTHTARLLIRSSTVQQLDFDGQPSAGYWRVGDIAPGAAWDADRQVAWAFLKGANDTGPFFVIGVHLSTDKGPAGEAHRVAFGKAAAGWAEQMTASRGLAGAPVVLIGDFNSNDLRQPKGVQQVLRSHGWKDAANAPVRRNADINTVNYSSTDLSGWPRRPFRVSGRQASRLDYIMYRGPAKAITYEVVAYLNPNGTYRPEYQGSDHQMVKARLRFAGYSMPDVGTLPAVTAPVPANDSAAGAGPGTPTTNAPDVQPTPVPLPLVANPAGPPFSERSIYVFVPTRLTQTSLKGHWRVITARSDGTLVEALLDGSWVSIPYRYDTKDDDLLPDPRMFAARGGALDPLGGVVNI